MKIIVVALASAAVAVPVAVAAQTAAPVQPSLATPIVAVARPSATDAQAALPANSEIWVSPNAESTARRSSRATSST